MKRKLLQLALIFSLALPSFAAETRGLAVIAKDPVTNQSGEVKLYNKSYAVIIGIDTYPALPRDRQLKNAVNDAKGVEQVLTKNYRFDKIIHLYNQEATKDRILEVLTEELPAIMGDQDSLFLFWAGHGNQEQGAQGKEIGYLVPYDGEIGKIRKNLTMTELRDTVSTKLPAKHVFYVMDACYGGLLASTRAVDSKSRRDLAYLKEITRENVRQVLTAGGKGEEVLDGGYKGHSVFTGRLVEALEAAGDFITANEIQTILREKVYGDSKTMGHGRTQTPAFGTLSGSGDFVFIPNLQQRLADSQTEEEKLRTELKTLEDNERKQQSEAQKRQAERDKQILQAKLKAEELRTRQLEQEQQKIQSETTEREAAQARYKAEQQKLANLRTELDKKKKGGTVSDTLTAAVTEIRKINDQILELEKNSDKPNVLQRHRDSIAKLEHQQKDEFETEQEHTARLRQATTALEKQRDIELAAIESQTVPLKEEIKRLSEREYSVEASQLALELGQYDLEKQSFPVTLRNRETALIKVALNGTIPLPKETARQFKQQWQSGLIRPELTAKAGGDVIKVALANDAESYLMNYENGEFITQAEKKRRQQEIERVAEEKRRKEEEMLKVAAGEFVTVPAGCFQIKTGTFSSQEVCLDSFRIGKFEVTQRQYKMIMGSNPSNFSSCGDDCPVEQVSWDDAQDFISKLSSQRGKSYRLPTEAEWHYACTSGGKNEEYCGGDTIDAVAWYNGNSGSETHPVGQKQANGLGIYDMSGNVWEWVQDWYGDSYPSSERNPTGASSGPNRVNHGGSWFDVPANVRSLNRSDDSPALRSSRMGFRLVAPVQ
jgi:formylglycine-generating enzyme required for sulfatase activity